VLRPRAMGGRASTTFSDVGKAVVEASPKEVAAAMAGLDTEVLQAVAEASPEEVSAAVIGLDKELRKKILAALMADTSDGSDGDAPKQGNVSGGLSKLIEASEEIEMLKIEAKELREETLVMLDCALPFLAFAFQAGFPISKHDVVAVRRQGCIFPIVRYVCDGLQILMMKPVVPVKMAEIKINRQVGSFIVDSFDAFTRAEMSKKSFLPEVIKFAEHGKFNINDETIELLSPYLRHDCDPVKNWSPWADFRVIDPSIAGKACNAVEGMANFVIAMVQFQGATKIMRPKRNALKVAEAALAKARAQLSAAQAELV